MSEAVPPLICPKSNEPCAMVELCGLSNAPLADAIGRITTASDIGATFQNPKYAATAITEELTRLGDGLDATFTPKAEAPGVTICPTDVLNRELPGGATKEQVAAGVGVLASKTVDDFILRTQVSRQGYRRTMRGAPNSTTIRREPK